MSNSHTKFDWILSNGLKGDSIMDRWTEGGDHNIPDCFIFEKKCVDNYNYIPLPLMNPQKIFIFQEFKR